LGTGLSDKELSWRFIEEQVNENADIERARKASPEHGDPVTASAGQYIATIATSMMLRASSRWEQVSVWVAFRSSPGLVKPEMMVFPES